MSETEVDRPLYDQPDDVYAFAGRVLGTKWEFPDGRTARVDRAVFQSTTEEGQTVERPELHFDHGFRVPASGFRWRIDPETGDVTPVGAIATQLVRVLYADGGRCSDGQ